MMQLFYMVLKIICIADHVYIVQETVTRLKHSFPAVSLIHGLVDNLLLFFFTNTKPVKPVIGFFIIFNYSVLLQTGYLFCHVKALNRSFLFRRKIAEV